MKNRTIKYIAAILCVTSCSLDVEVYDQLSSENVLNTESDVKAAVTGLYHDARRRMGTV